MILIERKTDTGEITRTLTVPDYWIGKPMMGCSFSMSNEARSDSDFFIQNGTFVARPEWIDFQGGLCPLTLNFSSLPSTSSVRVRNEVGDELEITDLNESLILTDAGSYELTILLPFPWKTKEQRLEIVNG